MKINKVTSIKDIETFIITDKYMKMFLKQPTIISSIESQQPSLIIVYGRHVIKSVAITLMYSYKLKCYKVWDIKGEIALHVIEHLNDFLGKFNFDKGDIK